MLKQSYRSEQSRIIGDSPSGQFTKRRLEKTYQKSGLITVANELGIELNYDTNVTKVDIPNAKKLKKTPICNFILDAEKIIAVPKIKTHSYMIMTLATKIMYGAVPGLTKAKYHSLFFRRAAFADMLLDVLSVRKPDLIVMDGITGMQGDGPSGGTPVELGVLLASDRCGCDGSYRLRPARNRTDMDTYSTTSKDTKSLAIRDSISFTVTRERPFFWFSLTIKC